jgi:hypothetical protein
MIRTDHLTVLKKILKVGRWREWFTRVESEDGVKKQIIQKNRYQS